MVQEQAPMDEPTADISSRLAATTDRQQQVDLLNAWAKELRDMDAQRALSCAEQALELARAEPPYPKGLAYSLVRLADCHVQLGHYDVALARAMEARIPIESHGYSELQPQLLRTLGMVYKYLGDYPNALTYTMQALESCRDDLSETAVTLNALGIIYSQMGDYRHELETYQRALSIFREIDQQRHVAIAMNNIATAHFLLEEPAEALQYGLQSLQMAREMGLGMLEAAVLGTLGDVYRQMADHDQALHHFQQALELSRRIGFKHVEMYALRSCGQVQAILGHLDQAVSLLQPALALAEETESRAELSECHRLLAEVHEQRRDFAAALDHYKRYHGVKETVFHEDADLRLKNLQSIHDAETARREAEILRLRRCTTEPEP